MYTLDQLGFRFAPISSDRSFDDVIRSSVFEDPSRKWLNWGNNRVGVIILLAATFGEGRGLAGQGRRNEDVRVFNTPHEGFSRSHSTSTQMGRVTSSSSYHRLLLVYLLSTVPRSSQIIAIKAARGIPDPGIRLQVGRLTWKFFLKNKGESGKQG